MPHRARDTAAAIAERSPDRRPLGAAIAPRERGTYSRSVDYFVLDLFSRRCIFPVSHLNRRERCLGRFGTWGWERRLGRGANVARRSRGALGIRPAPKGVCHLKLAGRGPAGG